MDLIREAYVVKWIRNYLKRCSKSGLTSVKTNQVWEAFKNPAIDGVMMADSILHRANILEFQKILQGNFEGKGTTLVIPEDIQTPSRQETTQPSEPISNRRLFAEKFSGKEEVSYFDPYIGTDWLGVFNTILAFVPELKLKTLNLLTTNAKITTPLKKQSLQALIPMFKEEYGIIVKIKILEGKEHPRFIISNGKIWKIGHSLNEPDKFEGIDEIIERKNEYQSFWDKAWETAKNFE